MTVLARTCIQGSIILPENFADIYTVYKCFTHPELRTTEIYAEIIDAKIKETVKLLPKLIFGFIVVVV